MEQAEATCPMSCLQPPTHHGLGSQPQSNCTISCQSFLIKTRQSCEETPSLGAGEAPASLGRSSIDPGEGVLLFSLLPLRQTGSNCPFKCFTIRSFNPKQTVIRDCQACSTDTKMYLNTLNEHPLNINRPCFAINRQGGCQHVIHESSNGT